MTKPQQPTGSRRAVVTGGSQGIGRGIIERLSDDGYETVNFDIQPPARLAARETHVGVDLRDAPATTAALERALSGGPILNLVNNVAINTIAPVEDVDPDDLDRLVAVNLKCAIRCMQALLPGMKSAGYGRIVGLSSRVALGRAGRSLFGSTKAAVIALSRAWALELGRHGITSNVVAPGLIDTPLFRTNNTPQQARAFIDTTPVGRLGEPADVAHAVAHFLDKPQRLRHRTNAVRLRRHDHWPGAGVNAQPRRGRECPGAQRSGNNSNKEIDR
jgi:NAD(P)-dependent dehydrogenase (short-subunit alcohol dehydrogenase family)